MDGRSAKEREGGNEKNNNDKSNFGDFWGGTFETAMPGTFVSAAIRLSANGKTRKQKLTYSQMMR